MRSTLVKPIDIDASTDRSILGHEVFNPHPVQDMGRVFIDPDGTLRSHKMT